MRRSILALLSLYRQRISPLYGPRCRYYPSCSAFAVAVVAEHGALRGVLLAMWRLLRCNPWTPGGVDLPPPRRRAGGGSAPQFALNTGVLRG